MAGSPFQLRLNFACGWDWSNIEFDRRIPGFESSDENDLEDWIISEPSTVEIFSKEDLIQTVQSSDKEEDENGANQSDKQLISHSEVEKAFECALKYIKQFPGSSPTDQLQLQCWLNFASKNKEQTWRQTKLSDFFKK